MPSIQISFGTDRSFADAEGTIMVPTAAGSNDQFPVPKLRGGDGYPLSPESDRDSPHRPHGTSGPVSHV